jgi:hypothetical protein
MKERRCHNAGSVQLSSKKAPPQLGRIPWLLKVCNCHQRSEVQNGKKMSQCWKCVTVVEKGPSAAW